MINVRAALQQDPRSFYELVVAREMRTIVSRIATIVANFFTEKVFSCCPQTLTSEQRAYQFEQEKIAEAIQAIPQQERREVIRIVNTLISDIGIGGEVEVIKSIAAIPADEREGVAHLASQLFSEVCFTCHSRSGNIDALALVPADERESVVASVLRLINEAPTNFGSRVAAMERIVALPARERADIVNQALRLVTPWMQMGDKLMMVQNVARIPVHEREDYIRNRLAGVHHPDQAIECHAQGVNVHEGHRDFLTRDAILLLRQHQGHISPEKIEQAKDEFIKYIGHSSVDQSVQQLATNALLTPRTTEGFGPLLNRGGFNVCNLPITGEEIIGRLWVFASQLDDKEQANAKMGMIFALKNSYEQGSRVCNQGKTHRLLIAVLQGRLKGVNIDDVAIPDQETPAKAKELTIADMMQMFFTPDRQVIASKKKLIEAANLFCTENLDMNKHREAFVKEINAYAEQQEMAE